MGDTLPCRQRKKQSVAIRAERFCGGAALAFFKDSRIAEWLVVVLSRRDKYLAALFDIRSL
jgi:hypothetical protein